MDGKAEGLLQTLANEEAILGELTRLAGELRRALVASDFGRVTAVAGEMDRANRRLRDAESDRERIVAQMAGPGATVRDLDGSAIPGLAEARARLVAAVETLQEAQEQNASIILGASRLVDRWLGVIVRLVDPTYGAEGKARHGGEPRFVSKSV
ncbi:MAG: hypothetical protein Kow0010_19390 [Dehalococcoidia bacterium]